ncbi:unnamed protein product [Ectocarpus sp. CCAP 1310/34]|nr:unnamed protein product [Ectocarpus sp. CCAP 1310/34]
MFASLDLEQKELKKLWIEFGKIDTDNGGTVSIRELLSHCDLDFTPFAYRLFGIFDVDNSGAVDFREFVVSTWNCCTMTAEMEAMLREVYGERFADSPAAALTLKRVKELSSSSDAGPTNETTILELAKKGVQVAPDGRIYALSFEAFREFCRQHAGMLLPAFTLQKRVRSKIVSEAFWKVKPLVNRSLSTYGSSVRCLIPPHLCPDFPFEKECADRRNGVRQDRNRGKRENRPPQKSIQLEHLSTMMSLDEKSATGTTTDNTPAPNGSATGTANTTAPGSGSAQTPKKALPSPSPALGDGIIAPPKARKSGSGGNDYCNNSSGSSSKTPATAEKIDDAGGCNTPDGSGEQMEGQARRGGDGGHEKGTGDGGAPRKRRSGSRGVVAVEGDEGSGGGSENKTPRFSMQAPQGSREGPNAHRVSGTPSHGGASQPATLRQGTPTNDPPTGTSATDNVAKTPQPRQTYPLPIDAGGRGTSAWARGGGEEPLLGWGGVPPGFAGGVGEEESAPGRRPPDRRLKKESRVDSPLAAAARAAAVYELPALRDTAATKRRSHQARDLVAGSGGRGGRPASAGGNHSPNARQRRRETGQAAAAARAVAGVAASGGHQAGSSSTTPHANIANVFRDTHEHHHSLRTFHDHRTVPKLKRVTHS